MNLTIGDIVAKVTSFLATPLADAAFKEKASQIAKEVLTCIEGCEPLVKDLLVRQISTEFKKQSGQNEKIKHLKASFCERQKFSNWKNAFMGVSPVDVLKVRWVPFTYDNSSNNPLNQSIRSKSFEEKNPSAMIGSTFFTNNPNRICSKEHHILDSLYGWACRDKKGEDAGFAIAVADGSGGHDVDINDDKRISKASYIATKCAVRILSAFDKPDELVMQLPTIIERIKAEIKHKQGGNYARTTLLACRSFPTDKGHRIVGFNVGDNMLIAWNPHKKELIHLLPSHCTQDGTALLPDPLKAYEIQIVDQIVPEGTSLFAMTDGIHDSLPYKEEERDYRSSNHPQRPLNSHAYRVRTLVEMEHEFGSVLKEHPVQLTHKIVNKAFSGAEKMRKEQDPSKHFLLGDDIGIIHCQLNTYKQGFWTRIMGFGIP